MMRTEPVGVRQAMLHGLVTSRSNWPLVAVRWLQDLLTFGLAAVGLLLPWWAVFGRDVASDLAPLVRARDIDALAEAVLDVWDAIAASPAAVTAGLAGLVAAWMLALCIYCWAQGGIWGVLAEAESGAELGCRPGPAFRFGQFVRLAGRYFWRLFWLVNLYATAVLGLVLLWLLPWALLPRATDGSVSWVAALVGLLLLVPLALAVIVAALWYAVVRADLVVRGGSVAATSRRAWRTLRRHPGTPILVSLAALAGVATVSALLAPLSGGSLALGGLGAFGGDGEAAKLWSAGALAVQGALLLAQGVAGGWIATVHAGGLVAWVAGSPGEGLPAREAA